MKKNKTIFITQKKVIWQGKEAMSMLTAVNQERNFQHVQ